MESKREREKERERERKRESESETEKEKERERGDRDTRRQTIVHNTSAEFEACYKTYPNVTILQCVSDPSPARLFLVVCLGLGRQLSTESTANLAGNATMN